MRQNDKKKDKKRDKKGQKRDIQEKKDKNRRRGGGHWPEEREEVTSRTIEMRTSVVGNIPPWMKFSKEQVFYDNSDNFFHLILRFCDEMCQLLSRSILFQESGYFFQDRWPVVPLLKWLQKISIPTILAVFKAFIKCPTSCALHENTKYKHNM